MSSVEFSYWKAFARINPFGEARQDYRTALIVSAIYNSSGREFHWMSPEKFMPDFENITPETAEARYFQELKEKIPGLQSPQEMMARARQYSLHYNAYHGFKT